MMTSVVAVLGSLFMMTSTTLAGMQSDGSGIIASAYVPIDVNQNYEIGNACAKQELLWKKMEATQHRALPDFKNFALFI